MRVSLMSFRGCMILSSRYICWRKEINTESPRLSGLQCSARRACVLNVTACISVCCQGGTTLNPSTFGGILDNSPSKQRRF